MLNVLSAAGYLNATGTALVSLDDNDQGWEDFAGTLFKYSAEVLISVNDMQDLPEFPELLKMGTSYKITGAFRASLIVASATIGFARFQTTGKAAQVLKYVAQSLEQLTNGKPVPPAPVSLYA